MRHTRFRSAGLLPLLLLLMVSPARATACDAATPFHSDFADAAHVRAGLHHPVENRGPVRDKM